jgi:hypothetical protein
MPERMILQVQKKTGWEIAALVLAFLRDLVRLIWEFKGYH